MRTLNSQFVEMMKAAVPDEGRNAETDKAIRFYFFSGASAAFAILQEAREASRAGAKPDGVQLVRRMQRELEEYRHEMHMHMARELRKSIEVGLIAIFGLEPDDTGDKDKHD